MDRSADSSDISKTKEIDALQAISDILQTGLNKRTTAVIAELIDSGIEPGSILDVIQEIRKSTAKK